MSNDKNRNGLQHHEELSKGLQLATCTGDTFFPPEKGPGLEVGEWKLFLIPPVAPHHLLVSAKPKWSEYVLPVPFGVGPH